MTVATAQAIQYLNLAYFGRPADPASLSAWPASGLSLEEIVLQFVDTAEYTTNTITPNSTAAVSGGRTFNDTSLINTFYQRLFGRLATAEEVAGWANALATGAVTYDYLGITIVNAGLNLPAGTAMRDVLVAKFDSAQLYTGILFNDPASAAAYATTASIQDGIAFNAGVTTTTAATAAEAQTAVTTMVTNSGSSAGGGGTAFTLTTSSDIATSNTFTSDVAIVGNFALNSLNNGDQLTGSGTNSSLTATLNTNGGINIAPSALTNIATINLSTRDIGAAGATTLNLTNATGLTGVTTNTFAGAVTLNNLASALTTLGVSNTNQVHTLAFADAALAGTTDVVTLTADTFTGAVAVNLNVATAGASAYETINVVSTGNVANVFNLATNGAGYTTINASGSAALTMVGQSAALTTFNAADATGIVTYTANAGELVGTYTGGSANDIFVLGGTYTAADTINGGDGTGDRLDITTALATGATAAQSNVSNIEILGLTTGMTGTLNVSRFGANTVRYGANQAGASTINFLTGGGSLDIQNRTLGGGLTIAVAGTATTDTVNITMGSAAAGVTTGAATTVNGGETVNLTTQGGAVSVAGGAFTITNTAASETLNLLGNQNFTAAAVGADAVNASGMTGNAAFVNTSFARATSFTGTGNADTVVGSTAADILNGGGGNDNISNLAAGGGGVAAADVINGDAGFDTIALRGDAAPGGALNTQITQAARIVGFTRGTTAANGDILALDATLADYNATAAIAGGGMNTTVAAAAAGATVIQTVAQNAAAAAVAAGADLIKLGTGVATAGLSTQAAFNLAIGTGTVTGLGAQDAIFAMFYDTTNAAAIIGIVDATNTTNTVFETGDTFQMIGSMAMSSADYTAFSNVSLAIV